MAESATPSTGDGDRSLTFRYVLGPDGLEADRTLHVDAGGFIRSVTAAPAGGERDGHLAIPGMPNAHSHVFQRALAGFGEEAGGEESFWGWRKSMYRLANALSPEQLYHVARHGYAEMLRAGYTSVAEFHYLHHGRDGSRGPDTAHALVEAARSVGLPLLLLPVYYRRGGFDAPAREEQRRFVHEGVDDFLRQVERIRDTARPDGRSLRLGIAPHSLRAVPPEELGPLLAGGEELLGGGFPVHIHVSEQVDEVDACRAHHGLPPIRLLAEHVELGRRWGLVHGTHATGGELEHVRRAGATVVLCPLTEAYLGDGLFPADEHFRAGGRAAVGSDANVRIDAIEELRMLELGQRLRTRRRPRIATDEGCGAPLWRWAAEGGARATGAPAGILRTGRRADLVVLEPDGEPWAGHGPRTVLDAWLLGGDRTHVAAVYVGGERVVERGRIRGVEPTMPGLARVVRSVFGDG